MQKRADKDEATEIDVATHLMQFDFLRQQKVDDTHWMTQNNQDL
jgi:hypothetical protein